MAPKSVPPQDAIILLRACGKSGIVFAAPRALPHVGSDVAAIITYIISYATHVLPFTQAKFVPSPLSVLATGDRVVRLQHAPAQICGPRPSTVGRTWPRCSEAEGSVTTATSDPSLAQLMVRLTAWQTAHVIGGQAKPSAKVGSRSSIGNLRPAGGWKPCRRAKTTKLLLGRPDPGARSVKTVRRARCRRAHSWWTPPPGAASLTTLLRPHAALPSVRRRQQVPSTLLAAEANP